LGCFYPVGVAAASSILVAVLVGGIVPDKPDVAEYGRVQRGGHG
jgi:hypothetical protein